MLQLTEFALSISGWRLPYFFSLVKAEKCGLARGMYAVVKMTLLSNHLGNYSSTFFFLFSCSLTWCFTVIFRSVSDF